MHLDRCRFQKSTVFFLRFAFLLTVAGPATSLAADKTPLYTLKFQRPTDQVADIRVDYRAEGHLKAPSDKKEVELLDMDVVARLAFQDRHLTLPPATRRRKQPEVIGAARHYREMDVTITIGDQTISPVLRDSRKLLGIRLQDGLLDYYSPHGPLTREELDLIRLPGDRQTLSLLLPQQPVGIGTVWQLNSVALAAFLAIDAVGDSDVKSELKEIEEGFARVESEGIVHGAIAGVATEITLKCRYYFYIQRGEFASLQLVTRERREIGHINPGVDVTARLKMRLEPQTDAGHLSDQEIVPIQQTLHEPHHQLTYQSPQLGVAFYYGRDWYATAEDRQAIVFRQLFRGDLVAQCNVSALPRVKSGKALTLAQFQKDIRQNLNKTFGSFVSANENTSEQGALIYRVEAVGTASSIPVRWIYYLLSDTTGRRVAMVFTMEQDQTDRFKDADRDWIDSLQFLAIAKEAEVSQRGPRRQQAALSEIIDSVEKTAQ